MERGCFVCLGNRRESDYSHSFREKNLARNDLDFKDLGNVLGLKVWVNVSNEE